MAKEQMKSRLEQMSDAIAAAKTVPDKLGAAIAALADGNATVEGAREALSELLVTSGLTKDGAPKLLEIAGLPYRIMRRNVNPDKDGEPRYTFSLKCDLNKDILAKYDFAKKA